MALLCAQLSVRVRAPTMDISIGNEFLILQGRHPYPEFQNHLLSPALLWICSHLLPGVATKSVWYLVRFLEAAAGFLTIYWIALGLSASRLRALIAVALVVSAYLWTPMTHRTETANDFFDLMFIALMVWCVIGERTVALALVTVLAAANRESAPFAGVMWICVVVARYGIGLRQWPKVMLGGVYMAVGMAAVYGFRYATSQHFSGQQYPGILVIFEEWRGLLHPTGPVPMIFATILVYWAILARIPRPWSDAQRGLLPAALIIAAIIGLMSNLIELRGFLSSWTILALIAVARRDVSDRQWIASVMGWHRQDGDASASPPTPRR
jgi:hypothetical protein